MVCILENFRAQKRELKKEYMDSSSLIGGMIEDLNAPTCLAFETLFGIEKENKFQNQVQKGKR